MIKSFKFFLHSFFHSIAACLLVVLPGVFLIGGCADPEVRIVPDVTLTEVSLTLSDTANLEIGAQIVWDIEPVDSSKFTAFNLYLKYAPEGEALLLRKDIAPEVRSLKIKLPDSSAGAYYYGIEGEYLSSTDQLWKSDSIRFEKIKILQPLIINAPKEGAQDTSILTVFELQTTYDGGVKLKFFAFTKTFGEGEVIRGLNFPFKASDDKVWFSNIQVIDSLQFAFPAPGEADQVSWCILATAVPGNNPLSLQQDISCSNFFHYRPQ